MEGNECYKFSTVRNFVDKTGQRPIRHVVEIGANVGGISLMMHEYFPEARIAAFEAVGEYCDLARSRTAHVPQIQVFQRAVTHDHIYADDLGDYARVSPTALRVLKGLPSAGPGWLGGSAVVPADHEMARRPGGVHGYELLLENVEPITLDDIFTLTGFPEIDLLKIDCEGCEHSVLGAAAPETLRRLRFITGEYHGLPRFYEVMRRKLFATHKVNLIGDSTLGAFFAERLEGERDGILKFNKDGMLLSRPWLCEKPIDWHLFNDEYVLPEDRRAHALGVAYGRNDGSTQGQSLPFTEFMRKAIAEAEPMSQNTGPEDPGFGWIYYGLIRNVRPDFVIAIGSARGFVPFCASRALQDNGRGHLIFIDPSYYGDGPPGWSGRAAWSDPTQVAARVADFGLRGWLTHLKLTSAEAFPRVRLMVDDARVGVVIVDGDHTHAQSLEDFELYSSLMDSGYVLFHDSISPDCGVACTVERLKQRGWDMITLHREVGLTILEIPPAFGVGKKWSYLCVNSNRATRLLSFARELVRPGDHVLDAYCGSAPLAGLLKDVQIFGFDCDRQIIRQLRERYPSHRWERINERQIMFASLPDHIDLLLGLGVSAGHARWDPQRVLENTRYLLGRYLPRACLFESAADYHDANILMSLERALKKLGYLCAQSSIETDLASFGLRRVLSAKLPLDDRSLYS